MIQTLDLAAWYQGLRLGPMRKNMETDHDDPRHPHASMNHVAAGWALPRCGVLYDLCDSGTLLADVGVRSGVGRAVCGNPGRLDRQLGRRHRRQHRGGVAHRQRVRGRLQPPDLAIAQLELGSEFRSGTNWGDPALSQIGLTQDPQLGISAPSVNSARKLRACAPQGDKVP